ncbi:hypothetical protein Cni_G09096 [Canna indica]|uniref:GIR1-like zinc ribbon domain-containing protein n=1 Tax=Canna indica TaxID=4628 RepID=A0AAQ3K3Z8_9LILI|nr:hypothetical protein Cni_G09096 [Canna indica]
MSRNNNRKSQKLDLKLNLSLLPPRLAGDEASPHGGGYASSPSASSCLSTEPDLGLRSPMSPELTSSMVLAGCSRCLMYVMLSENDMKCPKCGSTVLLDFFHGGSGSGAAAARSNKHSNKKTRMS